MTSQSSPTRSYDLTWGATVGTKNKQCFIPNINMPFLEQRPPHPPGEKPYLIFRSWHPIAAYFRVISTSMSYRVVFPTTWWVRVNWTPSTDCQKKIYTDWKANTREISLPILKWKFGLQTILQNNINLYIQIGIAIILVGISGILLLYEIHMLNNQGTCFTPTLLCACLQFSDRSRQQTFQ